MTVTIFAYTRRGCAAALRIVPFFSGGRCRLFAPPRFDCEGFSPIEEPGEPFYGRLFNSSDTVIFVGSCGIAVRNIAKHVADKFTDPAVLCVDELTRFVIPLLSGHIGGANRIALGLAEHLGAVPVITTATDINGRFSADRWAAEHGFVIDDRLSARAISAAVLEDDVPLLSDLPVCGPLPCGVVYGSGGDIGIYIGYLKKSPFKTTLRLIPPVLHIGIGCRAGVSETTIAAVVDAALDSAGIDRRAVIRAATVSLKSKEAGLIAYCAKCGWPLDFYPAEVLNALEGEFSASPFVKETTGTDCVCERAAMMGADRLILKKTALDGVTVAVAEKYTEVRLV